MRMPFGHKVRRVAELEKDLKKAIADREKSVSESRELPSAVPKLSERQYLIIQAMLELKALAPNSRRKSPEIAQRAEGKQTRVDNFKDPIAALEKLGLIATKEGRGGGCWLTDEGLRLAQSLGRKL